MSEDEWTDIEEISCEMGNWLFNKGRISEAKAEFMRHAQDIVGVGVRIPSAAGKGDRGIKTQLYVDMDHHVRTMLMSLCNGVAQCLDEEHRLTEALEWLEEVRALGINCYFSHSPPLFEWEHWNVHFPKMTLEITAAKSYQTGIFLGLGNTALAAYHKISAITYLTKCPPSHATAKAQKLANQIPLWPLFSIRHPEPKLTPTWNICHSELQIQGSWKKLRVKGSKSVQRFSFACFIWKSRLYVAGGKVDVLTTIPDMWSVDLKLLDHWRREPGSPMRFYMGWNFVVCPQREKAFLFSGSSTVDFFDLRGSRWGSMLTRFERTTADERAGIPTWPYPGHVLTNSTSVLVDGKIYVFGGSHRETNMGCSLFMQLDLETNKWTRLSGYVMPTPDYTSPGGRTAPSSWVDGAKERIYLLGGEAERRMASQAEERLRDNEGFDYPDFWSWSIKDAEWRRERLSGNYPSPRSQMGCVFVRAIAWTVLHHHIHNLKWYLSTLR